MLMLNKGGRLFVTCTEQIWSRTELLRGTWQQEKNSVAVRASKRRRYELNSDEKRASKRENLAREFRTNKTTPNVT